MLENILVNQGLHNLQNAQANVKRVITTSDAIQKKKPFPALRHKNFRYFWFGQCISLMGTWMQTTAQQWLVYTITKSPFLLGILGVGQFGPIMLFSLFAGVFADRYPKKRLLILTQTALMIQALILAVLVWSENIRYWQILILAILMGLFNTLDMPVRQSFIIELVGKEDLTNAIALNSTAFNLARIVGPALSAVIMSYYGAGFCFFLNGISFIPIIMGLLMIKPKPVKTAKKRENVVRSIVEGLKYIAASPVLLCAVLSMLAVGTFAMNINVLAPVFADKALNEGVHGYGLILSAMGTGSLISALLLAGKVKNNPSRKMLLISALLVSTFLTAVGFMHNLLLAILFVALMGFFNMLFMNTANSTIQLNSSDEFRGRTMSVYTLAFAGSTPVGNFFAGGITEKFGPGMGFIVCGGVTVALMLAIIAAIYFKEKTTDTDRKATG